MFKLSILDASFDKENLDSMRLYLFCNCSIYFICAFMNHKVKIEIFLEIIVSSQFAFIIIVRMDLKRFFCHKNCLTYENCVGMMYIENVF